MQGLMSEYIVPDSFANVNPAPIARATNTEYVRAEMTNVSAVTIFVGFTSQGVAGPSGPTAGAYRLTPGAERVFVLSPGQVMFAVAAGVGGRMAIALSEALPTDKQLG